jgi:hypothetical protein
MFEVLWLWVTKAHESCGKKLPGRLVTFSCECPLKAGNGGRVPNVNKAPDRKEWIWRALKIIIQKLTDLLLHESGRKLLIREWLCRILLLSDH